MQNESQPSSQSGNRRRTTGSVIKLMPSITKKTGSGPRSPLPPFFSALPLCLPPSAPRQQRPSPPCAPYGPIPETPPAVARPLIFLPPPRTHLGRWRHVGLGETRLPRAGGRDGITLNDLKGKQLKRTKKNRLL